MSKAFTSSHLVPTSEVALLKGTDVQMQGSFLCILVLSAAFDAAESSPLNMVKTPSGPSNGGHPYQSPSKDKTII